MNTIAVIIGVRGAGKTTLIGKLREIPGISVLQPSTTRKPRRGQSEDYHFVERDSWDRSDFAWTVEVGDEYYGMRLSQLLELPSGNVGVTVFYPGEIEVIEEFRDSSYLEIVTIGLDTIDTVDEQAERIGHDQTRNEGEKAFEEQREMVRSCDVVLKGNEDVIFHAVKNTLLLLKNRGVLNQETIKSLLNARTLLESPALENVQPASYDLRLGDTYWCKGETITLDDNNPQAKIPPYSYIIVKSLEDATLPKIIMAKYDLPVSLFCKGVILSNGPHVDPGYKGALLCLLFNSSDRVIGIRFREHFATIEFHTMSEVTKGYQAQYQAKKDLLDFIESTTAVGPGGTIADKFEKLENSWNIFRNWIIGIGIVIILGIIPAAIQIINMSGDARDVILGAKYQEERIARLQQENDSLHNSVKIALEKLNAFIDSLDNRVGDDRDDI